LQKYVNCDKKEEIPLHIRIVYPAESRFKIEISLVIRVLFPKKKMKQINQKSILYNEKEAET